MQPITTRLFLFLSLFSTLFSASFALPQLLDLTSLIGEVLNIIPILADPPPASLMTKNPSPECANVNQGALLCCESTFNGDIPIVVELSDSIGYKLNPNSINCIYGTRNFSTCSPGTQLCCQVDLLATTPISDVASLALYCQNAPGQNVTSSTSSNGQ